MDNNSENCSMQNSPQAGGGVITQNEYIQLINQINNALNFLGNSIAETRNQLQRLEQMVVTSHNVLHTQIDNIQAGLIRSMPRAEMKILVALAEHCNLNCAGCDHFSPLAEPMFADFDSMEKDFTRLSELFNGHVSAVSFQGGEPLLHPEITKFLVMARRKFPNARVYIITNGIKLLNMSDEFWQVCSDNNIEISPTKYPISIDYEAMRQKAQRYNIKFEYINAGETVKTLFKLPLDLSGCQDERRSFLLCHRANVCIYLQDGKVYTCTVAPTIRHFDKKFGTHLFDAETNSIDIYKVKSGDEILEFLTKPIPFCRFCKTQDTIRGIPWHVSKKSIDEWT